MFVYFNEQAKRVKKIVMPVIEDVLKTPVIYLMFLNPFGIVLIGRVACARITTDSANKYFQRGTRNEKHRSIKQCGHQTATTVGEPR